MGCITSKDSQLIMAARHGEASRVRDLLELGANVNAKDSIGWNPICYASLDGHTSVITELLKQDSIDVNATSPKGRTPLMLASCNGRLNVILKLLEHPNIDVNIQSRDGNTALMLACVGGKVEIVRELLKRQEINIDLKNSVGSSALGMAKRFSPQSAMITCFEEHSRFRTELLQASRNGKWGVVRQLLQKHKLLDVNTRDRLGNTPLILASQNGHFDIVIELTLHDHVELNAENNLGETALDVARAAEFFDVAEYLEECIRPLIGDALIAACRNNESDIVIQLLKHELSDPNVTDAEGNTPLIWACRNDNLNLVLALLKNATVDANARDNTKQWTPLMWACNNGNLEIVASLRGKRKLKMNAKDIYGNTALMLACQNGHLNVVMELTMLKNVDGKVANKDGFTAMDLARTANQIQVLNYLQDLYQPEIPFASCQPVLVEL